MEEILILRVYYFTLKSPIQSLIKTESSSIVLRQKRNRDDVLIIDALTGFVKEGKNNKLRECDIKKLSTALKTEPQ